MSTVTTETVPAAPTEGAAHTGSRWKEQRTFGIAMGLALGVMGGVFWWHDSLGTSLWLWPIGGAMLVLGLAVPVVLWPVWKVWTTAVVPVINWVLTHVLMGIVFYVFVTPVARVMALLGKDVLDRRIEPDRDTYWHARQAKPFDPSQCRKQF